jgi:hypothetical protein
MRTHVPSIRAQAQTQANELLRSIDSAEAVIVSTIERECEALRAGRMLAANALRMRLHEAARLYLNIMRAVRASTWTMEQVVPGTCHELDERRAAFAAVLRVELAVLVTERAAAETGLSFAPAPRPALAPVTAHPRRTPQRRQRLRRAS